MSPVAYIIIGVIVIAVIALVVLVGRKKPKEEEKKEEAPTESGTISNLPTEEKPMESIDESFNVPTEKEASEASPYTEEEKPLQ